MKSVSTLTSSVVFLLLISTAWAQSGTIQGNVYDDSSKEYLPGAKVSLEEITIATATDRNGNFRLRNIQ